MLKNNIKYRFLMEMLYLYILLTFQACLPFLKHSFYMLANNLNIDCSSVFFFKLMKFYRS